MNVRITMSLPVSRSLFIFYHIHVIHHEHSVLPSICRPSLPWYCACVSYTRLHPELDWISFGDFPFGNNFPLFILVVTIDFLRDGPYEFLLVWLYHGLVKIHVIFVCLVYVGNSIVCFLFPEIVFFHRGIIVVGRLIWIGQFSITWFFLLDLNGFHFLA